LANGWNFAGAKYLSESFQSALMPYQVSTMIPVDADCVRHGRAPSESVRLTGNGLLRGATEYCVPTRSFTPDGQ
jgi:hypothetical protein